MLEEIQRAVVGPVNIFQKDDRDLVMCNIGQELRGVMKGTVVDLLRIPKNALQVWAGGIVQADQVSDEVGIQAGVLFISDKTEDAALQFFAGRCRAVVVLDPKAG